MTRKLVLFDFDGTLTRRDSLWSFLFFAFPKSLVFKVILIQSLQILASIIFPSLRSKTKEKLLKNILPKLDQTTLLKAGKSFAEQVIPKIINAKKLELLHKSKKENEEVWIVSASLDIWLQPFADEQNVGLICTKWDFEKNQFLTPNCNGLEKVTRIKSEINLENYSDIQVFGNSNGDFEMMQLMK